MEALRQILKQFIKGLNNLFSKENLKSIVLSIIAAYIYQSTFAPDTQINVKIDNDLVIIQQGDKQIIVPRDVHEELKEVENQQNSKRHRTNFQSR